MTVDTTKPAKTGKRALGIKTWLGAGALTLGVGAALAGATAVAQADAGDHHSTSSNSTSDSGPKRTAGVASGKRASVQATKSTTSSPVTSPAAATAPKRSALAGVKPAVASQTITSPPQSIPTPFGPISVSVTTTIPDIGVTGDLGVAVDASTPIGNAQFSLSGSASSTANVPPALPTAQFTLNHGTLVVPAPVAFLVSGAGSALVAGFSVYDSVNSFASSLQSGNVLGAVQAFIEGGPRLTNALLFGQRTFSLPVPLGAGTADPALLNITFGGLFAPLQPVTLTWAGETGVQNIGGVDVNATFNPINVAFDGTRFGGVAASFGQLIGLL